jgi:hypothetical protein
MKSLSLIVSILILSSAALAAEKTTTRYQAKTATTTFQTQPTTSTLSLDSRHTLAFNFAAMAQGKANIYLDIGGVSENIAPSISYRSYSHQETRKKAKDAKMTVDRNLATLGASVTALRRGNKSLIVSPYLFFGTEKDALNTDSVNGYGARVVGQYNFNPTTALQLGADGNNMETDFKADAYLGLAMSL